jgi:hypothetical protein
MFATFILCSILLSTTYTPNTPLIKYLSNICFLYL